jgi:hypothetical protein
MMQESGKFGLLAEYFFFLNKEQRAKEQRVKK